MNNSSLVRAACAAKHEAVLWGPCAFSPFRPMARPRNATWCVSGLWAAVLCTFMGSLQAQSVAPASNPSSAPLTSPSGVPSGATSSAPSSAPSPASAPASNATLASPGNATQPTGAQAPLTSADSPLLYDKADRADKLLAAAKQEGTLTIYTCLLYTSPSPRDRQKSRMPSSA